MAGWGWGCWVGLIFYCYLDNNSVYRVITTIKYQSDHSSLGSQEDLSKNVSFSHHFSMSEKYYEGLFILAKHLPFQESCEIRLTLTIKTLERRQ